MKPILLIALVLLLINQAAGQDSLKSTHKSRAKQLVSQLTIEEKVSQLLNASPAISRLNIPEYNWWNECLHGVARASKATVFPQPIGLGASFDPDLVRRIGDVASTEARIIHQKAVQNGYRGIYYGLTVWSPNINLFRDPRWGRGHETYGEDPFLMGELGKAYIIGLQGPDRNDLKTIATPKHFAVHSGPENRRHGFNAIVTLKDLNESYLPHFRKAIIEGRAGSVMCAYNSINGKPACANDSLINLVLRKQWGFDGYMVSDCGAVEDIYQGHKLAKDEEAAALQALNGGLDLECMVGVVPAYRTLTNQFKQGQIDAKKLDHAVSRLFEARSKLGLLQTTDKSQWQALNSQLVCSNEHKQLALEAVLKSAVLLKNSHNTLPLKPGSKVALIGPHIRSKEALWGNYHGIPDTTITIEAGVRSALGKRVVAAEPGCPLIDGFPEFETISSKHLSYQGRSSSWFVRYYNQDSVAPNVALEQVRSNVDFTFSADLPPKSKVSAMTYTVDWTGQLVAPETGTFEIGALTEGSFKLFINGNLHIEEWPRLKSGLPRMRSIYLEKGQSINIRFIYNRQEYSYAKLVWRRPGPAQETYLKRAIEAAKKADLIVAAVGLSSNLEGEEMGLQLPGFESGDRTSLTLPAIQQELLRQLAKLNKPIVAVLVHGGPISDGVLDSVSSSIMTLWYPGQMGGMACAQLLTGQTSPAGRLPVTIVKSVRDLPPFESYNMDSRTYRFIKAQPSYAFGFGLSYAQFSYDQVELKDITQDSLLVDLNLSNKSSVNAEEVIQIYARQKTMTKNIKLVGMKRVVIGAKKSAKVLIKIAKHDLYLINELGEVIKPVQAPQLFIGGGQPDYLPPTSGGLWLKEIRSW